ncbi:unnamed protein product, partial [Symbiodinium pilosum]
CDIVHLYLHQLYSRRRGKQESHCLPRRTSSGRKYPHRQLQLLLRKCHVIPELQE